MPLPRYSNINFCRLVLAGSTRSPFRQSHYKETNYILYAVLARLSRTAAQVFPPSHSNGNNLG